MACWRRLPALDDRTRDSIPAARTDRAVAFEQALTLVYRVLFLLFAEARALVPIWQRRVSRRLHDRRALRRSDSSRQAARGLWEAFQAISRLAHAGCRAGDLEVTPFNGRLFSPRHTPLVERGACPDAVDARRGAGAGDRAITPTGRRRIAYHDLGVEQLGVGVRARARVRAVDATARLVLDAHVDERKTTGSFYTPRSITEFLVRRTLAPLVDGRTADEILALRVSIRRWAAARFSSPRAGFSRTRCEQR